MRPGKVMVNPLVLLPNAHKTMVSYTTQGMAVLLPRYQDESDRLYPLLVLLSSLIFSPLYHSFMITAIFSLSTIGCMFAAISCMYLIAVLAPR
jgi:hypothetical protein